MQTNEPKRALVEQQVRTYKNKAITKEQLYQKAQAYGWDKEAVDTLLLKEDQDHA